MKAGIGGFVGKVRGVDVVWIEEQVAGKSGDTLVAEAINITKTFCDESTFQLSAMANQTLDGVRLWQQSFSCRMFSERASGQLRVDQPTITG